MKTIDSLLNGVVEYFSHHLPVPVMQSWPSPDTRLVYPFIIFSLKRNEYQYKSPEFVKRVDEKINIFEIAEGQASIQIDIYASYEQERRDLLDKYLSIFSKDFSSGTGPSMGTYFSFGSDKKANAFAEHKRVKFMDEEGFKRVICDLDVSYEIYAESELPLIREIIINQELGGVA